MPRSKIVLRSTRGLNSDYLAYIFGNIELRENYQGQEGVSLIYRSNLWVLNNLTVEFLQVVAASAGIIKIATRTST